MENIKTKLKECVGDPNTIKEGFFIHDDGQINNHWIDLSRLHRQFLLNKKVVMKALRKKIIEEIKKNAIDTVIFATQNFSGTSDFRLSSIDSIVYNALREFNRKKRIEYTYLRRMATDGGLILNPEPPKNGKINVLLITALSSHEELIKESLDSVNKYGARHKSVLSIIGMETIDKDGKVSRIPDAFEGASHTYLITFTSDQRPTAKNAKEDHTIEPNIDYKFIDRLKDFFWDMRNIPFLAKAQIIFLIFLICVFGYYNPPNIIGFFELLWQNIHIIGAVASAISAISGIGLGLQWIVKKFRKAGSV